MSQKLFVRGKWNLALLNDTILFILWLTQRNKCIICCLLSNHSAILDFAAPCRSEKVKFNYVLHVVLSLFKLISEIALLKAIGFLLKIKLFVQRDAFYFWDMDGFVHFSSTCRIKIQNYTVYYDSKPDFTISNNLASFISFIKKWQFSV